MTYKTPGVYIQEISLFPPSVAEVATAIPAFIGHTQKAAKDGQDLTGKPTRITSLLEYSESFGGDCAPEIKGTVDTANNNAISLEVSRYYLYESLRLFFDNGGGPCWIISVGDYETDPAKSAFEDALRELEKYDEPTMIVMPDAVRLDAESLAKLQEMALRQCGTLGDRVGVFDLPNAPLATAKATFRNSVGTENLKYGAAYAPWIVTAYEKPVSFETLATFKVKGGQQAFDWSTLSTDEEYTKLIAALTGGDPKPDPNAAADLTKVEATITALAAGKPGLQENFDDLSDAVAENAVTDATAPAKLAALMKLLRDIAIGVLDWNTSLKGAGLKQKLAEEAASKLKPAVDELVAMEKNAEVQALLGRDDAAVTADYGPDRYDDLVGSWISAKPGDTVEYPKHYANDPEGAPVTAKPQAIEISTDLAPIFQKLAAFVNAVKDAATEAKTVGIPAAGALSAEQKKGLQDRLYSHHPAIGSIVRQIQLKLSEVPPSGGVSGVYAYVDQARGVWKAPANVSLAQVLRPVVPITDAEQQDLNVDVEAGKSINAIRAFTGRGTLIWGARTLAGNDNEWRYVNVRRFYNMVEESVKKSTAWAVFEPNSAPLWTKLKGMIENYLIQKWRDGALAGARPDDAFFVKVGLGQTMTAQDILEGRLNIEIGMAVVRPAEFIILKFSHLMQKS